MWDFQLHDNAYCKAIPSVKFQPAHVASARAVACGDEGKTQFKSSYKTFIVIFTLTGRRWDATSLIPSTQPLSKAAICFDWHSFVREERQCADSWWCKRRARKAFLSAAEEQIIFHCILQKGVRKLRSGLLIILYDFHLICCWSVFLLLLIGLFW